MYEHSLNDEPVMLFWDLFAGAGGWSTGTEEAEVFDRKVAHVITCVNHDANAIRSHAVNHPDALHFTEDIRTLDLTEAIEHTRIQRSYYPNAYLCLMAGLECTNFSKAKGGLARDADSRTLAEHLFRYLDALPFDMVFIENVEEFMSWGPLDENGKPVSKTKGQDYVRWCNQVQEYGYKYEYRILNSADFGAFTSRKRFFGVFVKHGLPMKFPQQTHAKKPTPGSGLQKWKAVKEVLDFSDEGESIFGRKKELSPKTLERVYAGLIKYVAKGDKSFIKKYYSGRPAGKVISTDGPAGTITTIDGQSLVQVTTEPICMLKYNSTSNKGVHVPPDLNNPSPVIATQGRLGVIQGTFLSYQYGNGYNSTIEVPAGTLTTKDRISKISYWLDKQYSGSHNHQSIEQPAGTVLTNDKHSLVEIKPWIASSHFNNPGSSIDEPANTITANRKWDYLMFPQWGVNCSHSTDEPSPTLIARMDKMCPYLLVAEETNQPIAIAVYDTDNDVMVRIKTFMAIYGITDIKMRMLRIKELKKITGLPEDYTLIGTQTEQKKYIGNAVVVNMARALVESFAAGLLGKEIKTQQLCLL